MLVMRDGKWKLATDKPAAQRRQDTSAPHTSQLQKVAYEWRLPQRRQRAPLWQDKK